MPWAVTDIDANDHNDHFTLTAEFVDDDLFPADDPFIFIGQLAADEKPGDVVREAKGLLAAESKRRQRRVRVQLKKDKLAAVFNRPSTETRA